MVEELIDVFKPLCKEKSLRLYAALSLPKNTYINGDANRIGQIISKLLHNAIKFTSRGHIYRHLHSGTANYLMTGQTIGWATGRKARVTL